MATNKKSKINTKEDLKRFLRVESKLYGKASKGLLYAYLDSLRSTPQSDQFYIWKYVKTLRMSEYYYNNSLKFHKSFMAFIRTIRYYFSLHSLRRYSYKTGIQISINSFDEGLQIYHFGTIIVNERSIVGKNATILPGVVVGEKNGETPIIGDNCYIGASCKVLGGITIGDNVTIAPNAVVVKDVPSNSVVAGVPAKVIKMKTEL